MIFVQYLLPVRSLYKYIFGCVQSIKSNTICKIPYEVMNKFTGLVECHLDIYHPDKELMKTLSSIKVVKIIATIDSIKDEWLSYWLTKSQSDFESVHHTLYITPNYGNTQELRYNKEISYIKPDCYGRIILNNGIIQYDSCHQEVFHIIKLLAQRFFIKYLVNNYSSWMPVRLYPIKFGIIIDNTKIKSCLLDFLRFHPNITYIGVMSNYWWSVYIKRSNVLFSGEEMSDTPCIIDIPIPISEIQTVHRIFPNMQCIRVISPINDPLPILPNVKVLGYDPILNLSF